MRIVPVIDLKEGRAVHARGGDRRRYGRLASRLGGGAPEKLDEPARLAALYRRTLRPDWIYVADLDRIGRHGDNAAALAAIQAVVAPGRLLWDGGLPDRAAAATHAGTIPILASETLAGPEGLRREGPPLWVGLDLDTGGLHAPAAAVRALGEIGLLRRAIEAGLGGVVIVLVDRVGTGEGLPLRRLERLREAAPGLPMVAGGGIATLADLTALRDARFDGALVATALHDGRLTPAALADAGFA